MKGRKQLFSTGKDDWTTPQDRWDEWNREYEFDTDAAASAENTKCVRFYTDALSHDWSGRVWCNPPYSMNAQFVNHASEQRNNCSIIVMLLPARTDTRWFHDYVYGKAEIEFIKGRLKFGDSKNSAPFPSMLVIFKKNRG